MINNKEINQSAILPFIYLFFTDISKLIFMNFSGYDAKESGFAIPFLRAYIAAFEDKSTGTISHDILKKINKISLQHLKSASAGEYRTEPAHFPINIAQIGDKLTPTYSASIDGVWQFISYWIVDNADSIHSFAFNVKDPLKPHDLRVFAVRAYKERVLAIQATLKNKSADVFDADKHYTIIKELLANPDYICNIDTAPYLENSLIQPTLQRKMQSIIDEFEDDICKVTSSDEIIYVIAKHVQRIEQLHPFLDGNTRTCYILINKLLRDFNLPLTILFNPNKLDACTIEEVVKMIKIGQGVYQKLLINTNPNVFLIEPEEFDLIKVITCEGNTSLNIELLEDFYRIARGDRKVTSDSKLLQGLTVFSHRPGSLTNSLLQRLQPLIDKNNSNHLKIEKMIYKGSYSLAFRNACATKSYSLINAMLPYLDSLAIDINETSTNGNTCLDWLDYNLSDSTSEEHYRIKSILSDNGGLSKTTLGNQFS